MAHCTIAATCPNCEEQLVVRVKVQTEVVPPLKLHFASSEAFADWLRASNFTLAEFERLPLYNWYRDEFEPFVNVLRQR